MQSFLYKFSNDLRNKSLWCFLLFNECILFGVEKRAGGAGPPEIMALVICAVNSKVVNSITALFSVLWRFLAL